MFTLTVSLGAIAVADQPAAPAPALFQEGNQIYTIDRDFTADLVYQGFSSGKTEMKYEFRAGRNLWNAHAQVRIRVPWYIEHPKTGRAYGGMGNISLGYSYVVPGPDFDHSLEARVALPTAVNGVKSNDTELKGLYALKWRLHPGAVSYINEFDQTIVRPPGANWTSYYDGKLAAGEFGLVRAFKGSAFYESRFVFSAGGVYRSAAGVNLFGKLGKAVAFSATGSWGVGTPGQTGLWKYKYEMNVTARP